MTTATIEVDEDGVEATPRRIALFTVAALLPAEFNDADIVDIVPVGIVVTGYAEHTLSAFIETKVQDARLVMTD